jgi:hypothetical protein
VSSENVTCKKSRSKRARVEPDKSFVFNIARSSDVYFQFFRSFICTSSFEFNSRTFARDRRADAQRRFP